LRLEKTERQHLGRGHTAGGKPALLNKTATTKGIHNINVLMRLFL
jgi:hypothetical protein